MAMSLFPALYVALMYGVTVPGDCGKGNLSEECNFGAFIDTKVFGISHMLEATDPEGLVTTLNSIFNTYIGMEFMRTFQRDKARPVQLLKSLTVLSLYLIIMSLIALIVTTRH
jgi:predicted acyltransferase